LENKREEQVLPRSWEQGGVGRGPTMYSHVSKCKITKEKKEGKKKKIKYNHH
jgi:hypothetical protein